MIGYLRGKVFQLEAERCMILSQGVGYWVITNAKGSEKLTLEAEAELWIEPIVHDGMTHLFGFTTRQEHHWFRLLTNVQGVGGKLAQQLLSAFSPSELCQLILTNQPQILRTADGVGPKLANRLISELHDKAAKWSDHPTGVDELVSALCSLGYRRQAAEQALARARSGSPASQDHESLLKASLSYLANHD